MDFKVIHKDGTSTLLVSNQYKSVVTSAKQVRKLCGGDTVTINLESAVYMQFQVGDTIEVFGTTYTMNQLPTVKKNGERDYEYTLVFEGLQYALIDRVFLMPDNTQGDNLMFDLKGMMEQLIDNINRGLDADNDKLYELGECPENSEYKNLSLTGKNCLQVLQQLCEEWDTEFTMVESSTKITINIGAVGEVFPVPFSYGRGGGVYELNREKGSSDIATRLFVYGGTQNLTYYRHNRLCLPNKAKNQSYVESVDAQAIYGLKEQVKNFDEIYPNRIGTITSVSGCDYNEFIDSTMNFDLNEKWANTTSACLEWLALKGLEDTQANRDIYFNDVALTATRYLMPGSSAKVHFNTGALAGYECDLHAYTHGSAKKFALIPLTDENGYEFPSKTNTAFRLAVGDEYVILDINLPQSYKDDAEAELQSKAQEYFATVCNPQPKYTLTIDPIALKHIVLGQGASGEYEIFKAGDLIHVNDTDSGVDADVRIDQFERDLIDQYDYKLTLTDEITYTQQVRTLIDVQNIKRVVEESKIYDVNRIRRGWKDAEELYNMVFDTEGQIYGEKIQPQSIDTLMLKVGARSQQFTLQNITFTPNYNNNPAQFRVDSNDGTLAHYSIDDDGVKTWNIASQTITGLADSGLYVYARCSRTGTSGTIIVSSNKIVFDSEAGWYNFLIGTLNSVQTITYTDGSPSVNLRTFSATYGYTTINGRFIRTGVIESPNGGVKIDLENGTITGNITLQAGNADNASIINALVDANSTVATASANASSAVDTAQTANSTANAVNTRVNNLSGRNYMRNTGYMTASTPPTLDGGTPFNLGVGMWGNGSEFQVSNTSATTTSMPYVKYAFFNGYNSGSNGLGGLVAGKTYTLSFDIRGSVAGFVTIEGQFYAGGAWTGYLGGNTQPTSQSAWSSKKIKIDIPSNATSIYIELRMWQVTYTGQWVNLRNVKLEEGEVVTPWSIAPEDTQQGIDLANLEGTCDCAHSQESGNAFTVECGQFKPSYLKKGTRIKITMALENRNSYRGTFNVNATGAKNLLWQKSTGKNPIWDAGEVVPFIYDGTRWKIEDEEQRILKQVYSEASSGSTAINGGMILTKLLQCGEGTTQAGISGLLSSLVAFWAGGNHAEASAFDCPVVIMRDGNAKFGLMRINKQGSITVPNTDGYSRLNIFDGNLPNPTSSAIKINQLLYIYGTTAGGSSSTLYVSGATMSADYNGQIANANPSATGAMLVMHLTESQRASIQFHVSLKCGSQEEYIVTQNDYDHYDSYWTYYRFKPTSCAYKYDSVSPNIAVTLQIVGGVSGNIEWSMSGGGIQLEFNGDTTVPKTNLASNGLQVLLKATDYFEVKQVGNDLITTIRGKLKAPGLLWAGNIGADGGADSLSFACNGVTASCYLSDTSLFNITINGVSGTPTVTATPVISQISGRGWSAMVHTLSFSGSTATIKIRTTSDNTNAACAFCLAVYGVPA